MKGEINNDKKIDIDRNINSKNLSHNNMIDNKELILIIDKTNKEL